MFSRMVRSSNSSSDWKLRDTPAAARRRAGQRVMSSPPMLTDPRPAVTNPVTASIRVVFPAPFGPITPWISPGATSTDTSCRAFTPLKDTDRPSTRSLLGTAGAAPATGNAGRAGRPGAAAGERRPVPREDPVGLEDEHQHQRHPADQRQVAVDLGEAAEHLAH